MHDFSDLDASAVAEYEAELAERARVYRDELAIDEGTSEDRVDIDRILREIAY